MTITNRYLFTTVAFLALLAIGSPFSAQTPAAMIAFGGARVIIGDGRVIDAATLVVSDGRVTQVGPVADVRIPSTATRVNAAGKTIMPAIVDTHTHLSQTRAELTNDLRRRAYFGVSAAMSLGQDQGEVMQMRGAPLPGAARFFSAGRGMTAPEPGRTTVPYWVTTETDARAAVRELAAQKVDIVKIWVDDRNGMYKKLSPELYSAIIDEAHRNSLRVTAHIVTLEDTKGLLRAGIDAFAHSVRDRDIDDEGLALFRAHPNVVVVPNLPDRGVVTDMSWLKGSLPDEEVARLQAAATDRPQLQQAFGIQSRNLAKLSAAGVTIAFGTDGNTPWAPHQEMEDMVASGMTPGQVITAATKNSAEFLRMSDAGTLEPGKSADFIVLDANPLQDIRNTRKISAVYLRGSAIDRTAR